MKQRKLKNGSTVDELEQTVELVVKTKCPEKWRLIDMETGEEYIGQHGQYYHWKKISNGLDTDK